MIKTFINKEQLFKNPIICFSAIYWIIMSINFFVTPNPYSAMHSGAAGSSSGVISTNFVFNQLYIILFAFIITILFQKKIILSIPHILLIICSIISGVLSNTLFSNAVTYLYNSITIISISTIAYIMAYNEKKEIKKEDLFNIMNIITVMVIIGVTLAIIKPNIYGVFSIAFSRSNRGEITYWMIFALQIVYPVLSIIIYEKYKKKKYIILALLMWIIIFASSKRNLTIVSLLPFIYYLIIRSKGTKKILNIFYSIILAIFCYDNIITFITLGEKSNLNTIAGMSTIFNGRYELWSYYLNKFLEKPIFGNGAYFLSNQNDYTGIATSEVGVLKWFGEFGIIYGGIMIYFLIVGIYISLNIMKNRDNENVIDLFVSYSFMSLIILVPQSFSRIVEFLDVVFWFSLFYLYFRKHRRLKCLILKL